MIRKRLAIVLILVAFVATCSPLAWAGEKKPTPVEVEIKDGKVELKPPKDEPAKPDDKKEPEKPKPKPTLPAAREAVEKGDYGDGLKILEAYLPKASPEGAQMAAALRVRADLETGKYAEAVAEAAKLAEKAPKDASLLALHAETLITTGKYEDATKQLAAAQKADAGHLKTRVLSLVLADMTGNAAAKEEQVSFFFTLYNEDKAKTAEALTAVARAVQDEDAHGAWQAYQEAQQKDASYRESYIEAGFLCVEKYAWPLARENFEKVLKANPNHAVAHAGMAAILLANSKYDGALKSIDAALKTNPNLPLALHLKASVYAAEQRREESLAAIQAALKVNPRNPHSLALLAAHHEATINPTERDKAIAQVLKTHPKYAEIYTTLGLTCERLRRAPSAIAWGRKAIEVRPQYWHGYYVTGMNLIRSGEEKEGYGLLEKAFQLNPFNIWAANTLTVLDRDFKKKEFAYHQTPHFFVKLDKSEDKVLWPYLEMMLEPMYERLTKKYGHEPSGPSMTLGKVLVLLYPKHAEFSARTTGLPGLSALGACLGQVITMPSPAYARQRPGGAFNWKKVLIHEFAHVVTLQKTDYRIPRWLTEGISVWEEDDTRVNWDQILVYGVDNDKLLPLEDFNRGFTRPKFAQQVPLSYYQAFLITRHFNDTYGSDALLKMLDLFREGKDTEAALPAALGKPLKELNAETLAVVRDYAKPIRRTTRVSKKELGELEEKVKKEVKDGDLWVKIAVGRLQANKPKEAREAAQEALKHNPKLARAHGILGFIARNVDKNNDEAIKHYRAAKEADANYFPARLALGLLTRADLSDEAIAELEAARKLAPRFIQKGQNPYKLLAQLYQDEGELDKAAAVLGDYCKLDSNDVEARLKLAEILTEQEKHAEAAAAYLESIFINPFDITIHLNAAAAYGKAKDPAQAAREFGVAVALEPKNLKALVGWARTLAASNQPAACRAALAAIRAIDPDNDDAADIEKSLKK